MELDCLSWSSRQITFSVGCLNRTIGHMLYMTWRNASCEWSDSEQKIIENVAQDLTQAQKEGQLEEWIRTSVRRGAC